MNGLFLPLERSKWPLKDDMTYQAEGMKVIHLKRYDKNLP
jgi:hypothetical protein